MKKKIFMLLLLVTISNIKSFGKWETVDSNVAHYFGNLASRQFVAIDCYDLKNCIALYKANSRFPWNRVTTDGGDSWFTTLTDTAFWDGVNWYNPPMPYEVVYPDSNLCMVLCDSGYYWRSRDKCRTWEKFKLGTRYRLRNGDFFDSKIGGVVGPINYFLTTDGGDSWFTPEIKLADEKKDIVFTDIAIPEPGVIILLVYIKDYGNFIIRTTDNGETWKEAVPFGVSIDKIFFIDKEYGWAVGAGNYSKKDIIFNTTDGGLTWSIQLDLPTTENSSISQIYFSDRNNGIALGKWYKIWTTTDGGKTWVKMEEYNIYDFPDYFTDLAILGTPDKFLAAYVLLDSMKRYTKTTSIVNKVNFANDALTLYPNPLPAGSQLNIKIGTEKPGRVEFTVYDALGGRVDEPYARYFDAGIFTVQYTPGQAPAPGSYWLRATYDNGSNVVRSFVVE